MLDKKTTKSIIKLFDLIPDGTEQDYSSFYDKVWVSQESLIKIFEDDSITCFEDLRDFVLSELKGEKEC